MAGETFVWWGRERTGLDELHHLSRHRILRTTRIEPHRLPCTEIGFVAKGELAVRLAGDGDRTVVGGQAVLIPPGAVFGSGDAPVRGLVYWIGVAPEPAQRLHPGRGLDRGEAEAVAAAVAAHHGAVIPFAGVLRAVEALAAELDRPEPDPLRRRALGLLLLAAVRDACRAPDDGTAAARAVVAPALAAIHADPGGDHLPDTLAALCGVGRTRFNEQFRLATGFPPRDYLTRRKLDAACTLLAAGTPVAVAARRLGFSSGQYLATAFRRCFATTPSAWLAERERQRESNGRPPPPPPPSGGCAPR